MNARIQAFLETLQTQMAQFQNEAQNMMQISTSEVERLISLSCMTSAPMHEILRALSAAMPSLEKAASIQPELEMTLNEARALSDLAEGASPVSGTLLERLCAVHQFFDNTTSAYPSLEITRNGNVRYGLGLDLHDGSLAQYLSTLPSICGMTRDAFYDHFFGDMRSPLRDAVEEGQNALAHFFEERFILRYDPTLCRKTLQLPEDLANGFKLLALHPTARRQQLEQVSGQRFEATRREAIRIGMRSLRGFAMMFDTASVQDRLEPSVMSSGSDTDKCLTLADAILSRMHGHLAAHWQNRIETLVRGRGQFEGRDYDEAQFLGENAQTRSWREAAFSSEPVTAAPEAPTPIVVETEDAVVLGDRRIEPLSPMSPTQKRCFIEAVHGLPTSQLSKAQAVEMPDGWMILCQNIPLLLSEPQNESACSTYFGHKDHALELWIRRLAAQIRGDILLDDTTARSLPLGSLEGQPYRRRWFRTTLSRLQRDPNALPLKAIIRSAQHAVDLYDNYDAHALRLAYDDFRAIRQQPHRRLNAYNAPPLIQMQMLTALWIADFHSIPAEILVPPLSRTTNARSSVDGHTLRWQVTMGTPVYPIACGRVTTCCRLPNVDHAVIIEHPGGLYSQYTGLATLSVTPGQTVTAETMLGRCGATLNGPSLCLTLDSPDTPIQTWSDFGHCPVQPQNVLHTLWTRAPLPEMQIF